MNGTLKFPKQERLRHKRLVDRVFSEGKSIYAYPLRMVYCIDTRSSQLAVFRSRHIPEGATPADTLDNMRIAPLQMMISVPKRKMKHAVDRVLLRRRIREAWRLTRASIHKTISGTDIACSVAIIYVGNEIHDYHTIEAKIRKLIDTLQASINTAAL